MNPPTIGHKRLASAIASRVRKETNANVGSQVNGILLLSSKENYTGQDRDKNPLSAQMKLKWAKKVFNLNSIRIELSRAPSAMGAIEGFVPHYDKIIYVHGSDADQVEFARRIVLEINKNGKLGDSEKLNRTSKSVSETGISATLVRDLVRKGDVAQFKKAYASLSSKDAEELFFQIRKGMTYK